MKTTALILLTALFTSSCLIYSQQVDGSQANGLLQTFQVSEYNLNGVKGSPYLSDEWLPGFIKQDDKVISSYEMRYNILEDRMEFLDKSEMINALSVNESFIVYLDGKEFKYFDLNDVNEELKGYFEIIKKFDEDSVLLKRYKTRLQEPNKAQQSGYSTPQNQLPTFKKDFNFYYLENESVIEIVNNKNRSIKPLDDSVKKLLKKFIKEHSIEFDDDGKGLVQLLTYYKNIK